MNFVHVQLWHKNWGKGTKLYWLWQLYTLKLQFNMLQIVWVSVLACKEVKFLRYPKSTWKAEYMKSQNQEGFLGPSENYCAVNASTKTGKTGSQIQRNPICWRINLPADASVVINAKIENLDCHWWISRHYIFTSQIVKNSRRT